MKSDKLKFAMTAIAMTGAIALALPAAAQGGGGGGGGGGGNAGGMGTGMGTMDRDRLQDPTSDPDRDRQRDQDRLNAGDKAQDRDQARLNDSEGRYLGDRDRLRNYDQDRDGSLNRAEFERLREENFTAIAPQGATFTLEQYHATRLGPGPYGSSNPAKQALRQEQANLRKTERFRLMDADSDGKVTRNEFMKFGEYQYLEADQNDDGRLSWKELKMFNRGM